MNTMTDNAIKYEALINEYNELTGWLNTCHGAAPSWISTTPARYSQTADDALAEHLAKGAEWLAESIAKATRAQEVAAELAKVIAAGGAAEYDAYRLEQYRIESAIQEEEWRKQREAKEAEIVAKYTVGARVNYPTGDYYWRVDSITETGAIIKRFDQRNQKDVFRKITKSDMVNHLEVKAA